MKNEELKVKNAELPEGHNFHNRRSTTCGVQGAKK